MFAYNFLRMMEMQFQMADRVSECMFSAMEMQRTFMNGVMFPFSMTHMNYDALSFHMPTKLVQDIQMHHEATFTENAFEVTMYMPPARGWDEVVFVRAEAQQAKVNIDDTAMQMEAAENEGMGTAITSDAPVQTMKQWFSKHAIASEQDTGEFADDNKRVYTPFGGAPNAPSAKAVLERYKKKSKSRKSA